MPCVTRSIPEKNKFRSIVERDEFKIRSVFCDTSYSGQTSSAQLFRQCPQDHPGWRTIGPFKF
jgi:hypothetical protein